MNKEEILETTMNKMPCPNCFDSRFQTYMSCEHPKAPCDFHAVCNHCNFKFFFTGGTKAKAMEEMWKGVEENMPEKRCPDCGGDRIYLEFLCNVLSKDCFFLVRCEDNYHYYRLILRE